MLVDPTRACALTGVRLPPMEGRGCLIVYMYMYVSAVVPFRVFLFATNACALQLRFRVIFLPALKQHVRVCGSLCFEIANNIADYLAVGGFKLIIHVLPVAFVNRLSQVHIRRQRLRHRMILDKNISQSRALRGLSLCVHLMIHVHTRAR